MRRGAASIDITNAPELARLAEEVRSTLQPRYLEKDGVAIAVVMPIATTRRAGRSPTPADREAFYSSFGAWRGLVDGARLKRGLARSRTIRRPAPEL
jgi:hypothetical protein